MKIEVHVEGFPSGDAFTMCIDVHQVSSPPRRPQLPTIADLRAFTFYLAPSMRRYRLGRWSWWGVPCSRRATSCANCFPPSSRLESMSSAAGTSYPGRIYCPSLCPGEDPRVCTTALLFRDPFFLAGVGGDWGGLVLSTFLVVDGIIILVEFSKKKITLKCVRLSSSPSTIFHFPRLQCWIFCYCKPHIFFSFCTCKANPTCDRAAVLRSRGVCCPHRK